MGTPQPFEFRISNFEFPLMYRLAYFCYWKATSLWHWARQRFTPAGFALLAAMFVCAISGFQTENYKALTQQTLCYVGALLIVAILFSARFRLKFAAERRLPRFGSVGMPMSYTVVVRNDTDKIQRGLIVQELLADHRPSFAEFVAGMKAHDKRTGSFRITKVPTRPARRLATIKPAPLPDILPGGEAEATLELLPQRRGVIRLTHFGLARTDPVGLFKALTRRPLPANILVLPKRYYLPPIALPGTVKYQQGGIAMASSIGLSDEFVSLRDYQPGDPLRRIHWKSWARVGEPVVKEFEDEFFVRHALILDTFAEEPDSWVFEEAVSVAASFACTIRTQESLLDLLFVGTEAYCFTAGRGLAHTEQLLEILAAVRVCAERPFSALSHLVLNHAGSVSGCIVILLSWDDARREMVRRLQALGVPLMLLLVTDSRQAAALDARVRADAPGPYHVLEVGKIEEGLAKVG